LKSFCNISADGRKYFFNFSFAFSGISSLRSFIKSSSVGKGCPVNACKKASALGVVSPANYNTPSQIVIGGEAEAVDKAVELLQEAGVKRLIPDINNHKNKITFKNFLIFREAKKSFLARCFVTKI